MNITFICTEWPQNLCNPFYCGVWNQTCNLSEVCLYLIPLLLFIYISHLFYLVFCVPDALLALSQYLYNSLWDGFCRKLRLGNVRSLTVCVCACACAQACLTLGDLMNYSPPGSPVHGIFQARILEWVVSGPTDTVRPLHRNEFYPRSVFLSSVFS